MFNTSKISRNCILPSNIEDVNLKIFHSELKKLKLKLKRLEPLRFYIARENTDIICKWSKVASALLVNLYNNKNLCVFIMVHIRIPFLKSFNTGCLFLSVKPNIDKNGSTCFTNKRSKLNHFWAYLKIKTGNSQITSICCVFIPGVGWVGLTISTLI